MSPIRKHATRETIADVQKEAAGGRSSPPEPSMHTVLKIASSRSSQNDPAHPTNTPPGVGRRSTMPADFEGRCTERAGLSTRYQLSAAAADKPPTTSE